MIQQENLTVYVAASYKHMHAVRLLHEALRSAVPGIRILDWTARATPPDGLTPAQRREWFDTEQDGGQVYAFCRDSCQHADLVIYLGASGQDAGVEIGMASAAGVPVLGLRGPLEAPGLMLHGAVDCWVMDAEYAVRIIAHVAACGNDSPGNCDNEVCGFLAVCPRGGGAGAEVRADVLADVLACPGCREQVSMVEHDNHAMLSYQVCCPHRTGHYKSLPEDAIADWKGRECRKGVES